VTSRIVKREQHTLPQQRWRAIVIIVDTPGPGEAHLTLSEIQAEFEKGVDLPAGLSFEFGTIEKAASPPPGSKG
jgi:hypothetical protein